MEHPIDFSPNSFGYKVLTSSPEVGEVIPIFLGLFSGCCGGGVIQGVVEGVVLYGVCSAQSRNFLGGVVKGVGVGVAGGI